MPEAPLRKSKSGLVVDGEGWFVVNARESRWKDEGRSGRIALSRASGGFRTLGSTSACSSRARYGASVVRETTQFAVAYAKVYAALPRSRFVKYRDGWHRETG
jgi:hypothetical protein